MIKTSILAIAVIAVACAGMRPTRRVEPGITETKTNHVRGAAHTAWPALEDR